MMLSSSSSRCCRSSDRWSWSDRHEKRSLAECTVSGFRPRRSVQRKINARTSSCFRAFPAFRRRFWKSISHLGLWLNSGRIGFVQRLHEQVRLTSSARKVCKNHVKTSTNNFYLCEKKFSASLSDRSRPHLLYLRLKRFQCVVGENKLKAQPLIRKYPQKRKYRRGDESRERHFNERKSNLWLVKHRINYNMYKKQQQQASSPNRRSFKSLQWSRDRLTRRWSVFLCSIILIYHWDLRSYIQRIWQQASGSAHWCSLYENNNNNNILLLWLFLILYLV